MLSRLFRQIGAKFWNFFSKATAMRGLAIVASEKGKVDKFEKCFQESIMILKKLGASFELQKTILDYAKILEKNLIPKRLHQIWQCTIILLQ